MHQIVKFFDLTNFVYHMVLMVIYFILMILVYDISQGGSDQ